MNADGSDVHVLVDMTRQSGHIIGLSWSPDGTRLAFGCRCSELDGIYVVDADGSRLTLTIPDGVNPHWSPDGSRISFEYDGLAGGLGGLNIADRDGRHVQYFGYAASGPWNPAGPAGAGAGGRRGACGERETHSPRRFSP